MSKKYIKKSSFVNGEQFKVSNGTWPEGVEVDAASITGHVYKYSRISGIKEEPGDPEPEMIEVKIPISNNDYVFTDYEGRKIVLTENEFNKKYEAV